MQKSSWELAQETWLALIAHNCVALSRSIKKLYHSHATHSKCLRECALAREAASLKSVALAATLKNGPALSVAPCADPAAAHNVVTVGCLVVVDCVFALLCLHLDPRPFHLITHLNPLSARYHCGRTVTSVCRRQNVPLLSSRQSPTQQPQTYSCVNQNKIIRTYLIVFLLPVSLHCCLAHSCGTPFLSWVEVFWK